MAGSGADSRMHIYLIRASGLVKTEIELLHFTLRYPECRDTIPDTGKGKTVLFSLRWKGSLVNLMELIASLYYLGVITDSNGNRQSFASLVAAFEEFLHIRIPKPYDLRADLARRKKNLSVLLPRRKYSINSLVYWVTYVHNVVYSFYRSMIYCYINSTQRCAGSIVIDIIPTNGADKRKFFPFAPYFPVTNVIKRYFYPYFPAIIGIKGYSFPYFPYLSGIMKIKTALYSLFSRLDWHKTVVFPCLGEIYEGIRSLSWEIPVT